MGKLESRLETTLPAFDREPRLVVFMQLAAVLLVAVSLVLIGADWSLGAIIGGAVVVLPNAWFAFAATRAASGLRVLAYGATKFVLFAALMVIALGFMGTIRNGFFWGFGAALVMQVVAPVLLGTVLRSTLGTARKRKVRDGF